jgi:prepilin-type N-terminal cleavage/methylation domain-containing protein
MHFSKIQLSKRSGFTLLEVLLASMIAVLLFGGLYVAMDVELRQANEGREAIERSTVSRAIINRIAMDLAPSLTPPRASPQPTGASSTSTSTSTTGATSSSSAASGSAASSASSSSSSTTANNSPPTSVSSTPSTPIPLAGGVIGYTDSIIIFTSRVPDPNYVPANSTDPVPSDIRRISYWLGSTNGGLCRQEIPWFSNDTFQMANSITYETGKTDDDYMIAPEVDSLQFEFFDINTVPTGSDGDWASQWDGTQPGPDGVTPYGPPTAIRITFSLKLTDGNGKTETKMYQHVIPLLTANGPNTAASGTATTGQ